MVPEHPHCPPRCLRTILSSPGPFPPSHLGSPDLSSCPCTPPIPSSVYLPSTSQLECLLSRGFPEPQAPRVQHTPPACSPLCTSPPQPSHTAKAPIVRLLPSLSPLLENKLQERRDGILFLSWTVLFFLFVFLVFSERQFLNCIQDLAFSSHLVSHLPHEGDGEEALLPVHKGPCGWVHTLVHLAWFSPSPKLTYFVCICGGGDPP